MQVKIFLSRGDGVELEAEINTWLKDKDIQISHVQQSYANDGPNTFYALISIWYSRLFHETSPI